MLLFTLNDAMLKLAGDTLPVGQVMILRGLGAAGLLVLIMRGMAIRMAWRDALVPMALLRAFCDAAASILFVYALLALPIATVTAFIQSVPVLSSIAGARVFRERISRAQWLSLGLCMAGVLAVTGVDAVEASASILVAACAVLLMVLRDLATRKTDPSIPSLMMALVSTLAVPLLSLPLARAEALTIPTGPQALLLAGTALCVGGGTLLLIVAMRSTILSRIAPFRYSAMIFAVLVGTVVWREIPDAAVLLGVVLILAGGAVGAQEAEDGPGDADPAT